jgi:uncharacterized repeat protein (TIGR03803 family)
MSLSSAGQLSGTPRAFGSFPFTLTVTDSSNPHQVSTESVTLIIEDWIVIAPASPPAGIVNYPYPLYTADPGFGFGASGGSPPLSWKVTSGSPPPGLTVGTDGSVSGTPLTTGTFSFSVTATDSAQPPTSSSPLAAQITVGTGPLFTLLHSFAGPPTDGYHPFGSLLLWGGDLYGTTYEGGSFSKGVVFKLGPNGEETVLHDFAGSPPDGSSPVAGLISDDTGNLYGTTQSGGAFDAGTVFKVDPTGKESELYSFTGGADGGGPAAGLVRDSAGNLYGTTGSGVVFELDPTGKLTVLYTFPAVLGGGSAAPLVRDEAGNLYGSTEGDPPAYPGRVFKLDPTGHMTLLADFTGGAGGGSPLVAGLILDPAGNLYGTTPYGGDLSGLGCGVVFKLDPTGKETVLYTFSGSVSGAPGADGCGPRAGLLRDTAGNLYGTTDSSNVCGNCGVVFKLDTTGKYTVLHTFTGPDGLQPDVGLISDANGALYGATVGGGAACTGDYCLGNPGYGVVFRLIP